MIKINIPGYRLLELEYLVLDFNGTLAVDGKLIGGVAERLNELSKHIKIKVITADTFGTVRKELSSIDCELAILGSGNQVKQKASVVKQLGSKRCVSIGNGFNDWKMLKVSALGIVTLQDEGAATKSIVNASGLCKSINDALDFLLKPSRLVATLRR